MPCSIAAACAPNPAPIHRLLLTANLHPALYSEVRRERLSKAIEHTDQLAGQMKRAADALVTHAFRVWDMPSAQRVKGCGPAMARVRRRPKWRFGGWVYFAPARPAALRGTLRAGVAFRTHSFAPVTLLPFRRHMLAFNHIHTTSAAAATTAADPG